MRTKCIRVPLREGEHIRMKLIDSGLFDPDFKIRVYEGHLLIPVNSDIIEGHEVSEAEMEPIQHEETDYKELLDLPDDLKEELPRSYDIVGDVAIIKLTESLFDHREDIGKALMKVTPNLRVVMMDSGVKGDLRIRDLQMIAGTGSSETIHKEFGVRMATDPAKVYFNPRLATERARIALEVKDGEIIIDMFAGVAPFGTIICKHSNPSIVYSIDLNPDAEYFMRKNMKMNNISKIVPMTGDARSEILKLPEADRILMNLPQMADQFLCDALKKIKIGGVIHLHEVLDRSDVDDFVEKITAESRSKGYDVRVDGLLELKTYSPTMSVYVFDIIRNA